MGIQLFKSVIYFRFGKLAKNAYPPFSAILNKFS